MPPKSEPSTVLIARFSALGDVALTVPAVYSACRRYPDVRFVMLTRPPFAKIFVNAPANLTMVPCDLKERYSGIGGIRRLVGEMVEQFKPDVFVDLHNVLRTRLMSIFLKLKGIPTHRLYKPRAQRRAMTRRRNKELINLTPQLKRYAEVFEHAGLPFEEDFSGLFGGRGKADAASFASITAPKGREEKWIGIAPFAAHPSKIYPPEMMEEVVRMLDERHQAGEPLMVFLFGGGQAEAEVLDGWAKKYAVCRSLASLKAGFTVELALMNHLDVMVAMDSGNMHLAAIAGAPVVSIWGATHPFAGFRPWGRDGEMVQLTLPCRPCSVFGNRPCLRGDLQCLRGISPQTIVDCITKKLNQNNG